MQFNLRLNLILKENKTKKLIKIMQKTGMSSFQWYKLHFWYFIHYHCHHIQPQ